MLLEKKISIAVKLCNRKLKLFNFTNFNRLYSFTTENIDGYIDLFNFKNRSLLTVGSSLDQALNAILLGCTDISILDICPFTKEYFYLKKAAISILTRDEYIDFFSIYSDRSFSLITFNKIKKALNEDEESLLFWEFLFENMGSDKIRNGLFIKDESPKEIIIKNNKYLNDDEMFNLLKSRIISINPKFYKERIEDICLSHTYDNIFLSNVFDYLNSKKGKKIIENVKSSLSEGGDALMYYLYETSIYGEDVLISELYDPTKIIRYVSNSTSLHEFKSIRSMEINDDSKDGVLIYKKDSHK